MNGQHHCLNALLLLTCLSLSSCKQAADIADEGEQESRPANVEHLEDPDQPTRITLTAQAAKRLDVQTAPISTAEIDGQQQKVIPYAAVLYDTKGNTWTWINPSPLTYVRHRVVIGHIVGDMAVLSNGPDPRTLVVTIGGTELYGSELEFEEE